MQKHEPNNFLTISEIIKFHEKLINKYGGIHGIRDRALLESALAQPKMTIFGTYAFKNLFEMAAAYCYHITKNHPFVDGNKRTGLLAAMTFLEKNGYILQANVNLYSFILNVASSKLSKKQICQFFKKHSIQIES